MRDRDGLLLGWGVGTATFPAIMFAAQAKAVLRADGSGVMEIGAHDMGQGAWTALAQIAADGLGLDLDQLEFRSGRSDLPDAGIAGGSSHTATAGTAIHNAGADVIARLADLATNDERSPLYGAGNAGVIARGGHLVRRNEPSRGESYADILIWGVSFALHEQAIMDSRTGRLMNANLAEYHVPVNADVPSLEAMLVQEYDTHVNPLGIKGVGEIGITGTAGAIANAVWHATGIRVRKFPITLECLIEPTVEYGAD
jgi:CO/xanthine dehydrogenase Mo-binding subunit